MLHLLVSSLALTGSVDVNALKATVKKNHPKIMGCYAPESKANPDLHGEVLVNFLLGEDGSAKNVKIKKSALKNANVEKCLVKVFSGITFPKAEGGAIDLNYPLEFSPADVIEEVVQGPPKKPGSLPPGAVRDTISAQQKTFQGCFDAEKKKAPALAGKVTTEFLVGNEGKVSEAVVKETTLKNEGVEKCLLDNLTKLQFPKPDGETGVRVAFPFNFN
jgi:hypothetical protein